MLAGPSQELGRSLAYSFVPCRKMGSRMPQHCCRLFKLTGAELPRLPALPQLPRPAARGHTRRYSASAVLQPALTPVQQASADSLLQYGYGRPHGRSVWLPQPSSMGQMCRMSSQAWPLVPPSSCISISIPDFMRGRRLPCSMSDLSRAHDGGALDASGASARLAERLRRENAAAIAAFAPPARVRNSPPGSKGALLKTEHTQKNYVQNNYVHKKHVQSGIRVLQGLLLPNFCS